ncbi:MAG: hypothetical protein AB7N76_19070 [Planctomycetota bacterium]
MFGGVAPDLDETPCVACGERVAPDEVVWDAWHQGDRRFAALPYHRRCAQDVLPPREPDEAMRRCARCGQELAPEVLAAALEALAARFRAAKGSLASPDVVWRLAGRDPRRWVPEHFACVLAAVRRGPIAGPVAGALPPASQSAPSEPPSEE